MIPAKKDIIIRYGIYIARYILHSGGDGFISPVDLLNWLVIIAKEPQAVNYGPQLARRGLGFSFSLFPGGMMLHFF